MTCKRLTALSRKIMKANGKTSGCVGSWKIQAHIASVRIVRNYVVTRSW